ncbi:hypothetical protein [Mycobacterium angelicum]|uniref:hypothetical protein n=1 Tax=Mycobacterium angelicum TaxID=470074 RepID=UPI001FECCC5A|nr:hypothetical protein [Mycobacterium angelicum]
MQQELRIDNAGVQAMAGRWGASAGELPAASAPVGLGLSSQASAAAVAAAHVGILLLRQRWPGGSGPAQPLWPKPVWAMSPMKLTLPSSWAT